MTRTKPHKGTEGQEPQNQCATQVDVGVDQGMTANEKKFADEVKTSTDPSGSATRDTKVEAADGGAASDSMDGKPTTADGRIRLSDLEPSRFNRSCGQAPKPKRVKKLAKSLGDVGVIEPVVLVRRKSEKGRKYIVLAGWHRIEALKALRGAKGMLEVGEYIVRDDLTEHDSKCLEMAIAENQDRHESTPHEQANHISRLVKDQHMDQGAVAKAFGIEREIVNALCALAQYYGDLPESWQRDLDWDDDDEDRSPAVTISHWRLVVSKIRKAGVVTPEMKALLAQAAEERWPTEKLRAELKGTTKAVTPEPDAPPSIPQAQPGGAAEEVPVQKPEPATVATSDRPGTDYGRVVKALETVCLLAGGDQEIQTIIRTAIDQVKAVQVKHQSGEAA